MLQGVLQADQIQPYFSNQDGFVLLYLLFADPCKPKLFETSSVVAVKKEEKIPLLSEVKGTLLNVSNKLLATTSVVDGKSGTSKVAKSPVSRLTI